MTLADIAHHCYDMTQAYLGIPSPGSIVLETQQAIKETRAILLNEVFNRWSPLNGEISFPYNGGKDCQVLLLLYLGCLWEFFMLQAAQSQYSAQYQQFPLNKLFSVYIDLTETFPSLETFVDETTLRYELSLYSSLREHGTKASNMSCAFSDFLKRYPETKAILIGVRATDPFGETLVPVQKTDKGWPDFYRVQPLLHWKLAHIWSFLLYSGEPVCGLYEHGFTSIGSIDTSLPNPHLKRDPSAVPQHQFAYEVEHAYLHQGPPVNSRPLDKADQDWLSKLSKDKYLPGWFLTDDSVERAGRIKRQAPSA